MQQAAIAARSPLVHSTTDYTSRPPPSLPPPALPPPVLSSVIMSQDDNYVSNGRSLSHMTSVSSSTEGDNSQADDQLEIMKGKGDIFQSEVIQDLPTLAELDPNFVFSEIEVYGFIDDPKHSTAQSVDCPLQSNIESQSDDKVNLIRSLKKEGDAFSLSLMNSAESNLDNDSDDTTSNCFDDCQGESGTDNVNQDDGIDGDDEYAYEASGLNMLSPGEQEDSGESFSEEHFSVNKESRIVSKMDTSSVVSPTEHQASPTPDEESTSVTLRWIRWFQGINSNWQKQSLPDVPPQVRALITAQRVWGTEAISSMRNATSFTTQRRAEAESSVRSVLSVSQDLALLSLPPSDELFLPSKKHRPRQVSLGDSIWSISSKNHSLQSQSPNTFTTVTGNQTASTQQTIKELPLPWPVSWRTVDTFVEECFNLNIHELFEAVIRFMIHSMAQERVAALRLKKLREQGKQKIMDENTRKSSFFAMYITSPQLNHLAGLPLPPRKLFAKWEVLIWELARCAQGCASKLVRGAQKRQRSGQASPSDGTGTVDGVSVLSRWLVVLSYAIQFWNEIEEKFSSKLTDLITNSSSQQMNVFLESGVTHNTISVPALGSESSFSDLSMKMDPVVATSELTFQVNGNVVSPSMIVSASGSTQLTSMPSLFDTLASSWHRTCRSPRLTVSGVLLATLAATYHIVSELLAEQSSNNCDDANSASSGTTSKLNQEVVLDASPCLRYDEYQACKQHNSSNLDDLSSISLPRQLVQAVVDAGAAYLKQKLLELAPESPSDNSASQIVWLGTTLRDLLSDVVMSIPSCSQMGRVRLWRPAQSASVSINGAEKKTSPKLLELLESVEIDLTVFTASIIDLGDLPIETKVTDSDNDSDVSIEDGAMKRSLTEMSDAELEQEGLSTPKPKLKRVQQSEATSSTPLSDSTHPASQHKGELASPQDKMRDSLTSSLRGEAELTPALLSVATAVLYGGNRTGANITACSPSQNAPPMMLPETSARPMTSDALAAPPASTSPGLSTRSPLLGNLKVKLDLEPTGPEPLRLGSDDDVVEILTGASSVASFKMDSTTSQLITAPLTSNQFMMQPKRILTSSGSIVRPILKRIAHYSSSPNNFSGSGSGGLRKRKPKSRGITWADNASLEKVRYFASSDAAAKANAFAGPPATPPPPDYSGILIEHIGLLSEEENLSLIQSGVSLQQANRSGGLAAAIRNRASQVNNLNKQSSIADGFSYGSEGRTLMLSTDSGPESPNSASKAMLVSELSRRQNHILQKIMKTMPGVNSLSDYMKLMTSDTSVTASTLATVTWSHPIQVSSRPFSGEKVVTPETEEQLRREKTVTPAFAGLRGELHPTNFEGLSYEDYLMKISSTSSVTSQYKNELILEDELLDFDSLAPSHHQLKQDASDKRESFLKYLSELDYGVPVFSFVSDGTTEDSHITTSDSSSTPTTPLTKKRLENSERGGSTEAKGEAIAANVDNQKAINTPGLKVAHQLESSSALGQSTKRSFLDYARARSNNQTGESVSSTSTNASQFVSQPYHANQSASFQDRNQYNVLQHHQYGLPPQVAPLDKHQVASEFPYQTQVHSNATTYPSNDLYQTQLYPPSVSGHDVAQGINAGAHLSGYVNAYTSQQSYQVQSHQVQPHLPSYQAYQQPHKQSYQQTYQQAYHQPYQHAQPQESYHQPPQQSFQQPYEQTLRQAAYQHPIEHQQPYQQTHPQQHLQHLQQNKSNTHAQGHYYQ